MSSRHSIQILCTMEYLLRIKDEASLIRDINEINVNYAAKITEDKIHLQPAKSAPLRCKEEQELTTYIIIYKSVLRCYMVIWGASTFIFTMFVKVQGIN